MSERKVLTKYYPPDFDPSAIGRQCKPKDVPVKLPTVRLMAPFSLRCDACGEYVYKGRKFNARKQISDMTYYEIKIIRFYIKCTRCAAEMTFLTDPKHNDYTAERGMRRNFEPWREAKLAEETEEERLDRLEAEERDRDPMAELEQKAHDAAKEMEVADALDDVRMRNARMERRDREGVGIGEAEGVKTEKELERERQEEEDAAAAKRAFQSGAGEGRVKRLLEYEDEDGVGSVADSGVAFGSHGSPERVVNVKVEDAVEETKTARFARPKKRKVDHAAVLGIKKRSVEEPVVATKPTEPLVPEPEPAPIPTALVAGDDDDW